MHENTHARTSFCALFSAMRLPIKRNEMDSILAADRGGIYGEKAYPAGTLNASSNHIWSSILSTGIPGNEAIVLHWSRWLTEPVCRWERKSKGCGVRRQISYFWLHRQIQSFTQIKYALACSFNSSQRLVLPSVCLLVSVSVCICQQIY